MKNSNPLFRNELFTLSSSSSSKMTVQGAVNRALILFCLLFLSAAWVWHQHFVLHTTHLTTFQTLGVVGGFIAVLITMFKPSIAYITAPIYAISKGLALSSISIVLERYYPGIALQAAALTIGTLFTMLIIYKANLIKVNERFAKGLLAATGGIALVYFASMIAGFFGHHFSIIHGNSPMAIGFSFIVVGIAAFNLLLDFEVIHQGERTGAPKYMEWYSALGLMTTLAWLYMEILRLLMKLRNNRK